jgi:4-amino-4-deoxy-L-arabinose transferase-like glycosyltransferase
MIERDEQSESSPEEESRDSEEEIESEEPDDASEDSEASAEGDESDTEQPDPLLESRRSIAALRERRSGISQELPVTPEQPAPVVRLADRSLETDEEPPADKDFPPQKTPWLRTDSGITVILILVGFFSVITTYGSMGWSWDEAYYLPPAQLALDWVMAGMPADEASIQRYWREINELPAFCKFFWAGSLLMFDSLLGTETAMRLPSALFFGLTLGLLYLFLKPDLGRDGALLGVVALFSLPRFFGHAHFATTEIPTAFMILWVTYAFRRGLDSTWWAVICGISFGLAVNTKINCFFLFPALVIWATIYHPEKLARNVCAMMLLAPVVFVITWPWLWPDPMPRMLDYMKFHATHQDTAVFYQGQKWGYHGKSAPLSYPFVLLAITTPITHLIALGFGLLRSAFTARRPFIGLIVIQSLVPLLIIAAPGQPKYDGIRLFITAFPFLAAIMAIGLDGILKVLARQKDGQGFVLRPILSTTLGAALVIYSLIAIVPVFPYYLAYFNKSVGGLPGAWDRGYEVTYWGERLNDEVLAVLNDPEIVPEGATLKTRAFFNRVLVQHQQWGNLRSDILIDKLDHIEIKDSAEAKAPPDTQPAEPPAFDFHLIQSRRGFWGDIDWALYERAATAPAIFDVQGVPFFILYGSLQETLD